MNKLLIALFLLIQNSSNQPVLWSPIGEYPIGTLVKYNNICFVAFAAPVPGKPPINDKAELDVNTWAVKIDSKPSEPCAIKPIQERKKHHVRNRKSH